MTTMPELVITIPENYLDAIRLFVAKNDIRYYLNGVLVEVHEHSVRLVATNGHILAVANIPSDNAVGEPLHVLLPPELLDAAPKGKPLSLRFVANNGRVVTILTDDGRTFSSIDGRFPLYEKVIPSEVDGTHADYDLHYLGLCAKASDRLQRGRGKKQRDTVTSPILRTNGAKPGLVTFQDPDFFVVIMPLRTDYAKGGTTPPAWYTSGKEHERLPVD